jgi:oligoendopeptidase F
VIEQQVPERHQIDPAYTWNADSVFASNEAWEEEFESISDQLGNIRRLQGQLGRGPVALADDLNRIFILKQRADRLFVFAYLAWSVDTADQFAAGRADKAQGLYGEVLAAVAFVEPELLGIGQETLDKWLEEEGHLCDYGHYFGDLFRRHAHIRSAEVEELMGMLEDTFSGPTAIFSMLTNSDFKFRPAVKIGGEELPVMQSTIAKIMGDPDRQARRIAWESHSDAYLSHKNSLASVLSTSIRQNVFKMRARAHTSTLEMALFADNIPVDVFHNLIDVYHKNLDIWHRYWSVRRQALGVETLHPYDIWAPLTDKSPKIPYEQAVDWICQALTPLGDEYISVMRKGCLEKQWVDIYPNQGKSAGAFSWGAQGTHPFIVMSYSDDVFSLGTLAHELGHSMHSYLSWQNQPPIYSNYTLFAAEVASNFHQAMLRDYLLGQDPEPALQISLIEEAMANFYRYFLVMPTLARFELETHQRVERGEGLTADGNMELLADLFAEGYGDELHFDRQSVGIQWAKFGHLYSDYYVFQYATGISGAHALSRRVLSEEKGAADDYLSFLKAGGSMYPLDALKMAGVDLSQPEPVEEAYVTLSKLVDKLETLVN